MDKEQQKTPIIKKHDPNKIFSSEDNNPDAANLTFTNDDQKLLYTNYWRLERFDDITQLTLGVKNKKGNVKILYSCLIPVDLVKKLHDDLYAFLHNPTDNRLI